MARAVWVSYLGKQLFDALERAVDRRFSRDLPRVQSTRDEQVSGSDTEGPATVARSPQPGEAFAALPDRIMDRALGWNPALQAERSVSFHPRCLFLRPFVPDNRFLFELAPFTSADPEPISKFPRMEVSCFRLVHGLGGRFISSGSNPEPTGSPRRRLDADWRREIGREIEAILDGGHLDKTLFLMPPSVLGRGMDQRARSWPDVLLLLGLALKLSRTFGAVADSRCRRLRVHGPAAADDPQRSPCSRMTGKVRVPNSTHTN